MDRETLLAHFRRLLAEHPEDLYKQLNGLRDWTNAHVPGFELYLEDVWNDYAAGETWIEYILRSLKTLNETQPLGFDLYKNHQDEKGVWHLDDYIRSIRRIEDPQELVDFIEANR